jgi:hypothetical protein
MARFKIPLLLLFVYPFAHYFILNVNLSLSSKMNEGEKYYLRISHRNQNLCIQDNDTWIQQLDGHRIRRKRIWDELADLFGFSFNH